MFPFGFNRHGLFKTEKTFGLHEVTKTFAPPMEGEKVLVTSCKPKVFLSVLNRPRPFKTRWKFRKIGGGTGGEGGGEA